MKNFFGSIFINRDKLYEAGINYPIKVEYYKIINEEEKIKENKLIYGIQIIKTEYREKIGVEHEKIEHITNDESEITKVSVGQSVDVVVNAINKEYKGTVTSVTFMGVHNEAIVDINGFKWMIQTTDPVFENSYIGISLDPDAIHIMKKSEYSGMFGDYSSFSNELDELSNPGGEEEE